MRAIRWYWFVSVGLGILAAAASAEDEFPYDAFVAVEDAEVVSGPGHRYYATDRLPLGAKVEIYREEASGWLAIRPPEGSFSWIPGDAVERTNDESDVGRVTEPTPCWIGTAAERVEEHRQHVELKVGEVVQILGEKQVADGDGEESTWLKIAPPAGEFRWVHLRDVSRQKPEPVARRTSVIELNATTEPVDEPLSPREPERIELPREAIALRDLEPAGDSRAGTPSRGIETAQFQSTSEPSGRLLSPDGFVPRKRRGSEPLQTVPEPSSRLARNGSATFTRPRLDPPPLMASVDSPRGTVKPTSSANSGDVTRKLEQLELELSLMLAQEKSTWNLADLRQRIEELVPRGTDPVERGQARLLLDKVKAFEETFDVPDQPVATSASGRQPVAATGNSPLTDPRYDGEGWLVRVKSKTNRDVPPFALVDRDSNPLCFVTPAPGFNLSAYENRRIGVFGRRGIMEETKKPHVLAERAIDLDKVLR
ncbi:MAG TPA: SH3 domain-containing protein [Pirellulaceae bacterium]|nr:SH3 domain-containing protein [Pirellulaceae bacterium]